MRFTDEECRNMVSTLMFFRNQLDYEIPKQNIKEVRDVMNKQREALDNLLYMLREEGVE